MFIDYLYDMQMFEAEKPKRFHIFHTYFRHDIFI